MIVELEKRSFITLIDSRHSLSVFFEFALIQRPYSDGLFGFLDIGHQGSAIVLPQYINFNCWLYSHSMKSYTNVKFITLNDRFHFVFIYIFEYIPQFVFPLLITVVVWNNWFLTILGNSFLHFSTVPHTQFAWLCIFNNNLNQ